MEKQFMCEFCHKSYSTKGILKRHTETAKVCLLNRVKIDDQPLPSKVSVIELSATTYNCKFCDYLTTQKHHLKRHHSTCKKKIKSNVVKNKNIEIEILKLKNKVQIASLAAEFKGFKAGLDHKNPKITNNIINYHPSMLQNIPVERLTTLTDDHIKLSLIEYNYEEFQLGFEGVIRFFIYAMTGNFELSPDFVSSYYCIEPDRMTFYRYVVEGWIKDPKGQYINDVLDIMKPEVKLYYKKFRISGWDELRNDKGECIADIIQKELYTIFKSICNYTEEERDKFTSKIRTSLAKKLRIRDVYLIKPACDNELL